MNFLWQVRKKGALPSSWDLAPVRLRRDNAHSKSTGYEMHREMRKTAKGPQRFECVMEPTDTWMVFDTETCMPASIGGCILTGCQYQKAESARLILERIYAAGLENKPDNEA